MLPYLSDPKQESIRSYNFTQVGPNAQAGGALNGPCQIGTSCTQIPVTEGVCEDNGGIWWGATEEAPDSGYEYCCDVNAALYEADPSQPLMNLQPLRSVAVRNDDFKVVWNYFKGEADLNTNPPEDKPTCGDNLSKEFYHISESDPFRIDYAKADLLQLEPVLTPHQLANYIDLTEQLEGILTSEPPCIGDGNIDGVVDGQDLLDWEFFWLLTSAEPDNSSSWYDINQDGKTNLVDYEIIKARADPVTVCGNP